MERKLLLFIPSLNETTVEVHKLNRYSWTDTTYKIQLKYTSLSTALHCEWSCKNIFATLPSYWIHGSLERKVKPSVSLGEPKEALDVPPKNLPITLIGV